MALKESLIAELKHEAGNTRKMLERLPVASFGWKPHEKSYSLLYLAQHIANLPIWASHIVNEDFFDLTSPLEQPESIETTDQLLNFFDSRLADAIAVLQKASEETFDKPWELRREAHAIFSLPAKIIFRNLVLNHIVHHRGQLSVYLRLLNIPVPGMYGPSADER